MTAASWASTRTRDRTVRITIRATRPCKAHSPPPGTSTCASELKFESDLPYEILTGKVRPWSYDQFQNRYVNVAETLANAMTQNKDLKVFVANGYFDLATPFLATEYTFSHMRLDPDVRGNVTMDFFDAGHMMYTHLPSLERVKAAMAKFIAGATPKSS